MMMLIVSAFAALAFANIVVVVALPGGAPVCTVGSAAPSSLHLTRPFILTGGLPLGNFKVVIGANQLSGGTFVNRVTANTNLSLQVSGAEFKGVLVILNKDGTNLVSSLTTSSSLLQTQSSCPPSGYGGFTHTSRDVKTSVSATINMPANLEAFLDVNVVVANNATSSIYYYSRYMLSTMPAPVAAPVSTPVKAPVAAPVAVPVKAPVAAPVSTPVKAPVAAPVATPVKSPVAVAPVSPPVKAPAAVPMAAPVAVPVPVGAPTRASPCGLLGLSILCFNGCGLLGRILGLCEN